MVIGSVCSETYIFVLNSSPICEHIVTDACFNNYFSLVIILCLRLRSFLSECNILEFTDYRPIEKLFSLV